MKRTSPLSKLPQARVERGPDEADRAKGVRTVGGLDEEYEAAVALPRDHPVWRRDRLSASGRAKSLLERLIPIVVRVFTFWDHRVTSISVEGQVIEVDGSGSYRIT